MEPESVRVREFIERLVESLVSGELDNVCIKRLHSHSEYDRMFACHHAPLCEALARLSFALQMAIANKHMAEEDSPSAAHAALKQLVHQIIHEAMDLPKFRGMKPLEDDMNSLEEMESKTYEDILATAILNKVIERYQQRENISGTGVDGNSNHLSPELMSLVAMHQPHLLSNSESGVSAKRSYHESKYLNNCDSASELSNTDPLSVTIEECIEEVTTFSNAEDDTDDIDSFLPGLDPFKIRRAPFPEYGRDIIDGPPLETSGNEEDEEQEETPSEDESEMKPTDVINPVDSWEENWLFQKRRLKVGGVAQSMPVPMLVPNPSEDYRALIGDRDAEDISDLSDCSDGALEDVLLAEDEISVQKVLSPITVVTPSNTVNSFENVPVENEEKSLNIIEENNPVDLRKESVLTNDSHEAKFEGEMIEGKNTEYLKSSAEDCLSEFGQQEGEYTEDYAGVTQRQLDSLTATSDPESTDTTEFPSSQLHLDSEISRVQEPDVAILQDHVPGESDTDHSLGIDTELSLPPRPGTIAEREHKKWETAPPIPNNPYSPENIIKRLYKAQPYKQANSSGDAALECSKTIDPPKTDKIVEEPLQVICSPSDVDYERYGRDYYINAQAASNNKKTQLKSPPPQEESTEPFAEISNQTPGKVVTDITAEHMDSNNIKVKVALWQKDINAADQYYKNILNRKQDSAEDSENNDDSSKDSSLLNKSMISNGNGYDKEDALIVKQNSKHNLSEKVKQFEKLTRNELESNIEELHTDITKKREYKNGKMDLSFESLDTLHKNGEMESSYNLHENGSYGYTNGHTRSDSPSGSSVLTTDSDSMPSVRELTKRFSGFVDSDSSASSQKSVSPAPQWKKSELTKKNETKAEPQENMTRLNPPRTVHSLTARSISREFREELRHNQPIPLNKNVYKQINPKNIHGINNQTVEENKNLKENNASLASKSPVPYRSMKSNIAFWEKMQKNTQSNN